MSAVIPAIKGGQNTQVLLTCSKAALQRVCPFLGNASGTSIFPQNKKKHIERCQNGLSFNYSKKLLKL
jgi:hypothetical protein